VFGLTFKQLGKRSKDFDTTASKPNALKATFCENSSVLFQNRNPAQKINQKIGRVHQQINDAIACGVVRVDANSVKAIIRKLGWKPRASSTALHFVG